MGDSAQLPALTDIVDVDSLSAWATCDYETTDPKMLSHKFQDVIIKLRQNHDKCWVGVIKHPSGGPDSLPGFIDEDLVLFRFRLKKKIFVRQDFEVLGTGSLLDVPKGGYIQVLVRCFLLRYTLAAF